MIVCAGVRDWASTDLRQEEIVLRLLKVTMTKETVDSRGLVTKLGTFVSMTFEPFSDCLCRWWVGEAYGSAIVIAIVDLR